MLGSTIANKKKWGESFKKNYSGLHWEAKRRWLVRVERDIDTGRREMARRMWTPIKINNVGHHPYRVEHRRIAFRIFKQVHGSFSHCEISLTQQRSRVFVYIFRVSTFEHQVISKFAGGEKRKRLTLLGTLKASRVNSHAHCEPRQLKFASVLENLDDDVLSGGLGTLLLAISFFIGDDQQVIMTKKDHGQKTYL